MVYFKNHEFLMKMLAKQMSVSENASAVTVEWRSVELRTQKELGKFTFQVGNRENR